jgi:hypothetical protein
MVIEKTPEAMYNSAARNGICGFIEQKLALRNCVAILKDLDENEEIHFVFFGMPAYKNQKGVFKHENTYGYAITNKRLIYALDRKGSVLFLKGHNEDLKSVPLKSITDIKYKTGLVFGTILVGTDGTIEDFIIDFSRTEVESVFKLLLNAFNMLKVFEKKINTAVPDQITDVPGEIKKYKELFDDGIITQDEFELKKKALLQI